MNNRHILYVEDDESLGFVVKDNLEHHGFSVDLEKDGQSAWIKFKSSTFDLCILDIMLPKRDGFDLAKSIRNTDPDIPLIFLSAKAMKEDRIKGLKIGADDYLTKPFAIEELLLRMKAILRRGKGQGEVSENQSIGIYQFDYGNLLLMHLEKEKRLTQREADLLQLLLQAKGNLVNKKDILLKLWGDDDYFKGRSMDVFISRLRKYLANDPSIQIRSVHGVGVQLVQS